METYCNSEYDVSPDVSVEGEEEDEDEPQERQTLSNSLKNFNRNSGRGKTFSPDAVDIAQSEDSGFTWETSSSRRSTSQASETSVTSGVYSMDNSYVDSPPGRDTDEGKTAQKTNDSLDQMPSFSNQNSDEGSKMSMQVTPETRELSMADPLSWPLQVQPSKIKEYLIQITQEVESPVPEEKENALKKKGELPLKGTVRARIEQITAVLEERNKRIFRRVNEKNLPSSGTRKPIEPPKIFSRQGISVSLRHVERDTRDKNNKKEIMHYNLKPVQTNISKSGVSTPYKKDERKMRKSVLPETLNKASQKPSPILSPLADKVNKPDNESYSPVTQTSVSEHAKLAPPDDQDGAEKKAQQSFLPEAANVMSEKSSSLVEETGKQTMEQHLSGPPEVPCISQAPEKQTAQLRSPISAGPLSYSANEEENQTEPTAVVLSESAAWDAQYPKSEAVQPEHEHSLPAETESRDIKLPPSKLESKDLALLHSAEETGKQTIPPYSTAESLSEEAEASHSVTETEKKGTKQMEVEYLKKEDAQEQPATVLQTEPDHLPVLPSAEESATREAETVPVFSSTDHSTEIQECQRREEHFGLPQPSHLMNEAETKEKEQPELDLEKQGVQTQTLVTASLGPEFQEVPYSRDREEYQTVQLEFQHLDTSLPIPPAEREVHQDSVAIIQSESEQPVISEAIKALQESGHTESSHTEVSPHSPTERRNETSEQLPSISSLLTDNVEKEETRPSSVATAVPQSEQPNSVLSYTAEQMEKQDNLLGSPEKAILVSEVPLPPVAVQNAEETKLEIQPDSTTKATSEESESISRESAVAEEKTIQPDLPLSAEPPPKASVQLQEAAGLENRAPPSIKAELYSEDQEASSHTGDDGQERDHHLFPTFHLERKHAVTPETQKQNTNDSIQPQLEMDATVALSFADEADNKIMKKSITEPSLPDSLGPVNMPEKQERVQMETEQTPHQLVSESLQKEESNIPHSVEEMVMNGTQFHLPATAKDSSEPVCSTEPQDSGVFSTGLAGPDSGLLNTQNSIAEAMTHGIAAPESDHVAKLPTQAAVAELEPATISVFPSMPESRKHFDTSFSWMSADEGDRFVTPQSDHENLISVADGKVTEHYSTITPTSFAATEPEGIQSGPSNEASKQSPMVSSLSLRDTEFLESSVPAPDQSDFLLSDHNNKPQKEENQFLFPKKSESVPEEQLSITAFLMGETREEALHSSRAVKIVPEESKAIPEDVASEAVKETAPSFSPASEEHLSKETFSSSVGDRGEEQAPFFLTEESKQLAAEKADVQDVQSHLPATVQSEKRNEDVELYCPVTAQSEPEDRTSLNTTEGISKQEMPQYLLSDVQSAPTHQGLLYHREERDNQEKIPLETEHSKFLQSPVVQKEPEHVDLRQPIKELEMEAIQPYSSATVEDLSQPAGKKGEMEPLGYLLETAEVDFGVTSESMDEVEKKEIQPPRSEAEKLEYKQSAPSLLTEVVEKQGGYLHSSEEYVSAVLRQSNSTLMDFTEEEIKKPEVQPCPPQTVVSEEPLSIAAFLLSEAKEMQTSFPKTEEKESLDIQLPFKEPNLLLEGSTSVSAWPSETDEAIKREIQPSPTHFETEQLSHQLQAEITDQENRENICNIPTEPNLILNGSSDTVLSEPMNDTQPWSADSDKTTNKAILISSENVSGIEDIKNLRHADMTWKQTENYLEKEKELVDNKKPREETIAAPELDQGKDASSYSENHETVNIHVVGAPLFHTENGTLSQTPLIPLPDKMVNPELIEGHPVLASWNRELYEKAETESKEDSYKHPSDENIKNTDVPLHGKHGSPDDEITAYFEKGIPKDSSPNNLKDPQREQVLEVQHVTEEPEILQGAYESNEKECESVYTPSEASAQAGVFSLREIVDDALIEGPAEIASDVKVVTCQPTHAIPFGSRLYHSGATSDESGQNRAEESSSSETSQMLPEETSDEESSPILDYAATVYQTESSVLDESDVATCLATDQTQQSEITEADKVDNDVVRKPVEEGAQFPETFHHVSPHWQSGGQLEEHLFSVPEPVAQGTYALDQEHSPSWDFERQTGVKENIACDLAKHNREDTNQHLSASEAKSDKVFGGLDFSLLSHDFESYPLYSIKEEEYSDDEDLAELMGYETVTQDDVFQEETASELAREELLFDDRKSLDGISDSYEFINEKEASDYVEEEELIGLEKLPKNVPESEVLQKETELANLDTYCCECKCPISADDKLWGEHKDHSVTNLDTGVNELKGQLDGFLDILQERSLKIEGLVSEIEALFNTLEENCKGKEQLLEEQHENIVKMVLEHHDQKAQRFEEIKNTKMEYLYEQMVNFQDYVDTAKETLETIIKETEEVDDFAFLKSSEEINKRLLSAVEDIQALEKMPNAFSHFEHFAGKSARDNGTLEHMAVPQTPKLQPQEPNSATSTSIVVFWTVSEDDVIDFFQVYCMEERPGRQEQSGLVEEYRVTVKESNCILEDLEPGHCYSVWIMAVNYTGCSFPSEKSTFRTAPPTPVIKAEDCTVCWDTATIRWSTGNSEATDSFTLEYCRQYSPEGEGLRSLAGIKRPELKVNLEPNINYFFYVRAVNVFGTSEQSEAALISTKGTRFHIMKETAHPALQVSPNGTTICLPEETQITGIPPVWGELLSSQGCHYWEVTVTGCETYKIGICYSGFLPDSILGQNSSSWCLYCSSKTSLIYKVLHNGEMSDVLLTEWPARIGILLDYNTGRLLFFNAERGQVLFAVRHKFTAAVHPAFGLEQPGILHLHTGMELPEFVKHS